MVDSNVGFAVLYRWRLNLADDGSGIPNAQWPDRGVCDRLA